MIYKNITLPLFAIVICGALTCAIALRAKSKSENIYRESYTNPQRDDTDLEQRAGSIYRKLKDVKLPTTTTASHIVAGVWAFGPEWQLKGEGDKKTRGIEFLTKGSLGRHPLGDIVIARENQCVWRKRPFELTENEMMVFTALAKHGFDLTEVVRLSADAEYSFRNMLRFFERNASEFGDYGYVVTSHLHSGLKKEKWRNKYGDKTTVDALVSHLCESIADKGVGMEMSHLYPLALYAVTVKGGLSDRVRDLLHHYLSIARESQNDDGSYGKDWLVNKSGPKNWSDGLFTTSKMLQWMIHVSNDEDRKEDGVVGRCVAYITTLLFQKPPYIYDQAVYHGSADRYWVICHAASGIESWLSYRKQ